MNELLKQLLRVVLQIGIGLSTAIIFTGIYYWYKPIIFITVWATLWLCYDRLMREK